MIARSLAAAIVIAASASVAQAGAVYGSNATSTFAAPIVRQVTDDSAMNSAPNGVAPRFRNNIQESGQQTFTVEWDVTGAEGNIKWRLYVLGRTDAGVSIIGVQLEDGSGNFASSNNTLLLNTGPVGTGTITLFELTGFQLSSDYGTVDMGFNFDDIVGLLITFQLDNPAGTGRRSTIQIDAVSNPEPGTIALFGLGALGLGFVVRRRRRRALPA